MEPQAAYYAAFPILKLRVLVLCKQRILNLDNLLLIIERKKKNHKYPQTKKCKVLDNVVI